MSRPLRDDLASALRQRDLVALQIEPNRIAPPAGRHHDHGNAQLTPSGFHLRRTLPQMSELVHGRLVSHRAKAGGLCEATYVRRQGSRRWAKRDAEEPKDSEGREEGHERCDSWNLALLILVGSIDEHQTGNPLGLLGCEEPHRKTPD